MTTENLPIINLIDKYNENQLITADILKSIEKIDYFTDKHPKFSIGDLIEFTSGYNNDIRYQTKIIGFDENENIYVYWDSPWFPIRDDKKRNIVKL